MFEVDFTRPRRHSPEPPARSRVLVADDDIEAARFAATGLLQAGFDVVVARNGQQAVQLAMRDSFSAILLGLPLRGVSEAELDGIRSHDAEPPVILLTAGSGPGDGLGARNACPHLVKPLDRDILVRTVQRVARLSDLAILKREAQRILGIETRHGKVGPLDHTLASLRVALQPIVSVRKGTVEAFEVFMRGLVPALPSPPDVLAFAERTGRLPDVGRLVRRLAADAVAAAPQNIIFFVNIHAQDLVDPDLHDPAAPLGKVASRCVLEVTERARVEQVPGWSAHVAHLRELGFRIALDDLGTARAGANTFIRCEPEFIKVDMSLVRGIHESAARQRLVRGLQTLCADLGSTLVAEGVEMPEERDVLARSGYDLMQGYLFGEPRLR